MKKEVFKSLEMTSLVSFQKGIVSNREYVVCQPNTLQFCTVENFSRTYAPYI